MFNIIWATAFRFWPWSCATWGRANAAPWRPARCSTWRWAWRWRGWCWGRCPGRRSRTRCCCWCPPPPLARAGRCCEGTLNGGRTGRQTAEHVLIKAKWWKSEEFTHRGNQQLLLLSSERPGSGYWVAHAICYFTESMIVRSMEQFLSGQSSEGKRWGGGGGGCENSPVPGVRAVGRKTKPDLCVSETTRSPRRSDRTTFAKYGVGREPLWSYVQLPENKTGWWSSEEDGRRWVAVALSSLTAGSVQDYWLSQVMSSAGCSGCPGSQWMITGEFIDATKFG